MDIVRWRCYIRVTASAVLSLKSRNMTDTYDEQDVSLRLIVDADIEVDPHGVCNIVPTVFISDEDEGYEFKIPLEGVIDALIEEYRDSYAYNQLYVIAHELGRQAERLRTVGGTIEDSTNAVSDLFNISDD